MSHEMLTQHTFFCHHTCAIQKGYAESAFCDACRTSSGRIGGGAISNSSHLAVCS